MGKIFTIALLIILIPFLSACGAQKTQSKYFLGKKYKKEITQIIEEEYPKAIRSIDEVFVKFEKEKDPLEKELIVEWGIYEVVFNFLKKLVNKTEEYVNHQLVLSDEDWDEGLYALISPYLKKNKINESKINALNYYAQKKQEDLEKRR